MNKRQRKILIVVIFFVSLGLIAVQIAWIGGAYENKKIELERIVNESLSSVVKKIWHKETTTQVIDRIMGQLLQAKDTIESNTAVEKQLSKDDDRNIKLSDEDRKNFEKSLINDRFSGVSKDSIIKEIENNPEALSGEMRKYFVEQLVERLFWLDVPIEQRVTIDQVDSLFKQELSSKEVNLPFYANIYHYKSGVSIMSSESFSLKGRNKIYEERLFPDDPEVYSEKYYLQIYLQGADIFVIKKILPMATVSGTLILLILSVFIYTMWIILRQKKISEIKGDFISNITHELRTPIATISLAAQLLEDKNVSNEMKDRGKLSGMIKEQSKHLSYLVEKVLQTSVFEKQAIVLKPQSCSVHQIISEAVDIMSLQLRNKKADFSLQFEAINDMVAVDKPYFLNVITNLIDNSLKYSDLSAVIRIGTKNKQNNIIIAVKDNGKGISKENQNKIFEQFYRVSTGNVHNIKGFGLGLNYVKKIVEMSNGTVTLESMLNVGTTFFISLPLIKH